AEERIRGNARRTRSHLLRALPDRRRRARPDLAGRSGCGGEAFLSATSGALVLGGCANGPLRASIFDENGGLAVSKAVAPKRADAVGLVDAKGAALVVVWPGSAVGHSGKAAGRWFDASL